MLNRFPAVTATPITPGSQPPSVPQTPSGFLNSSSSMMMNSSQNRNNNNTSIPNSFQQQQLPLHQQHQQQQQQFLLVVNSADGKRYKLVTKSDVRLLTGVAIKRFVEIVAGIPQNAQILRFGGTVLGDTATPVGQFGVEHGDVLGLDDARQYNMNQSSSSAAMTAMLHQQQQQQQQPQTLADLAQGSSPPPSSSQHHHNSNNNNNITNQSQTTTETNTVQQLQHRLIEKEAQLRIQQEALQNALADQEKQFREQQQQQQMIFQQQQQQNSSASMNNNNNTNNNNDQSASLVAVQMKEIEKMREDMKRLEATASSAAATAQAALETSSSARSSWSRNASVNNNNNTQNQNQQQLPRISASPEVTIPTSTSSIQNNSSFDTTIATNNTSVSQQQQQQELSSSTSGKKPAPPVTRPRGSALNVSSSAASSIAGTQSVSNSPDRNELPSSSLKDRAFLQVRNAIQWLNAANFLLDREIAFASLDPISDTWTVDVITNTNSVSRNSQIHQQQQIQQQQQQQGGSTHSLLFSFDDETKRLYLYTTLLHFLPSDPTLRLQLFEILLEGSLMGREMAGGGVGVSVKSNLVLMATSTDMRHTDENAMASIVGTFVESADAWQKACMHAMQSDRKTASY